LPIIAAATGRIEEKGKAVSEGTMESAAGPTRKSADERKEALARAVHTQVAQGARVESQGDYQAILVKGHRVNHVLHLILSLFTLGIWLIVWIALVIFGGEKRMSVNVDEWGNTNVQKL
jgi:hypothetical protein